VHTAHHILSDQVKEDQMGRACSSPGEEENFLHGLVENLKEGDCLEYVGVDKG